MVIINGADWAKPKRVGNISEFAVFTPIKLGRIPGQRVTYEERLRIAISVIQTRAGENLPTGLKKVASLHYGKLAIFRPEQFGYNPYPERDSTGRRRAATSETKLGQLVDPYKTELLPHPGMEVGKKKDQGYRNRSFLLTTVTFDGDIKVYFRDIAEFVAVDFDRIYRNCEEYPGTEDFEKFWLWIRSYQVEMGLFYSAYPQLSVARIKYLERFKAKFDAFAEKVRSPNGQQTESMEELFDEFLRESQQISSNFPAPSGLFED